MSARTAILGSVLVFLVGMGALTIKEVHDGWPSTDVLEVTSLVVLALFAFGIVGALLHPPEE